MMSDDDTAASPEDSDKPAAKTAPRVRRVSTPRPKKVAKSAADAEAPAAAEVVSIPFPKTPNPEREIPREQPPEAAPSTSTSTDWPEPEAASNGGSLAQSEPSKRKRRRRKGKGQNSQPPITDSPASEEQPVQNAAEGKSPEAAPEQRPRPQQQPQAPRIKIDPEILNKMAWKIYLAEVSEEGVALIGDNDAKDLSRRCFRLAEIFIEEQSRHR